MKELLRRLHTRCGDLWWYTLLLFVVQRFSDVIHMFIGMWLVPRYVPMDELGAVLPLMQAVGFIALPLSIATIPFMKFITVFIDQGEEGRAKAFVRDVFIAVSLLAVVSFLLAYFVMPLVFERLRVECGSLGVLVMAIAILTSTSAIFGFAVQGFRMYSTTIWIHALQAPLRLVLMLVTMPFRALSGYMVGQTAGPIVQISAAVIAFHRRFGRKVRAAPYWSDYGGAIIRYTVPFAIWSVVSTVAGSFDMLVVRHRLPEIESAGYYMLTRFTDIASYLGLAASGFLFPMVASRAETDSAARRMLGQSLICAVGGGGIVIAALTLLGDRLLGLIPEWRAYVPLSNLFPLIGGTTVMSVVATCLVTYETAQGRFGFLWYAVPIFVVKTVFLYGITGYTFFAGMVPDSLLSAIASFDPCRLRFVAQVLLAGQTLFAAALAVDVFCFRTRPNSRPFVV